MRLPGGISARRFLREHWQRRPLLVRKAFPGFRDPLTPDELAGLACEPELESRLVMERGGRRPWQLERGPFTAARLRRLPRTHWTLLVQEVDRVVPSVAALKRPFGAIPGWRVDDVMISFAPRYGSVGPHVDSYDVFLVQGLGRRRWRIEEGGDLAFRDGLDVRILRRFRSQQEWVLEPGDVLYVPPGVAHHGVALEDCLTYSIGFRAPSHADLLLCALEAAQAGGARERLYADTGRAPARESAEIPRADLAAFRALVRETLGALDGDAFTAAVGALLTRPGHVQPSPRRRTVDAANLRRPGVEVVPALTARLAWHGAWLFADGRAFRCGRDLARRIASGEPLGARDAPAALLAELVNGGTLELRRARRARRPAPAR